MPKIEIELDTKMLQRAENIAQSHGQTLEEWLAQWAQSKTRFRTVANAWEHLATPSGFVRLVLLTHWDPIGIFGYPGALDEYDSYAEGVCNLLASGASEEEVMAHLNQIEKGPMGMRGDRPELREVAALLRRVFETARSA